MKNEMILSDELPNKYMKVQDRLLLISLHYFGASAVAIVLHNVSIELKMTKHKKIYFRKILLCACIHKQNTLLHQAFAL